MAALVSPKDPSPALETGRMRVTAPHRFDSERFCDRLSRDWPHHRSCMQSPTLRGCRSLLRLLVKQKHRPTNVPVDAVARRSRAACVTNIAAANAQVRGRPFEKRDAIDKAPDRPVDRHVLPLADPASGGLAARERAGANGVHQAHRAQKKSAEESERSAGCRASRCTGTGADQAVGRMGRREPGRRGPVRLPGREEKRLSVPGPTTVCEKDELQTLTQQLNEATVRPD
jgi:hypothetical protein